MIRFEGMDEIVARLNNIADSEKIRDAAEEEGAEYMRKQIEHEVQPIRSKANKQHAADNVIKVKSEDKGYEIGFPSKFYYMQFIEWGTKNIPARPFMSVAFEKNIQKTRNIMASAVQRELRK